MCSPTAGASASWTISSGPARAGISGSPSRWTKRFHKGWRMSWPEIRYLYSASRIALLLPWLLLAGCATPPAPIEPPPLAPIVLPPPEPLPELKPEPPAPPPPSAPPISEEAQQALSLLAECQHLLGLSVEEQKHEYNVVNQLVTKNK